MPKQRLYITPNDKKHLIELKEWWVRPPSVMDGYAILYLPEVYQSVDPEIVVYVNTGWGDATITIYKSNDLKNWIKHDSRYIGMEYWGSIKFSLDRNYIYYKVYWHTVWADVSHEFEVYYYPRGFKFQDVRYAEREAIIRIRNDEDKEIEATVGATYDNLNNEDNFVLTKGLNEIHVLYDEHFIPKKEYTFTAYLKYKGYIIDSRTVKVTKKKRGFLTYFLEKRPNNWWTPSFNEWKFEYSWNRTRATSELEVYPLKIQLFLQPGFNYTIHFVVKQYAGFCYEGDCFCVSWPNKYTTAFVNICGPQDEIWDYVYHDKSWPEVILHLNGAKFYHTIMTGAYKSGDDYISDTSAINEFDLILTQIDDNTYEFRIKNFKEYTEKGGRVILYNVKELYNGKVKLGSINGRDILNRVVVLKNVLSLYIEVYNRTGCSASISSSDWPKCYTYIKAEVKNVE